MKEILMQVQDLSYRYEDQTLALDKINLNIYRHQRLAIMGSNGSGKSTLFLNLNGVYKPTSGQILYEGKPLDYSRKGLLSLRKKVGIVFQEPDNQSFVQVFSAKFPLDHLIWGWTKPPSAIVSHKSVTPSPLPLFWTNPLTF